MRKLASIQRVVGVRPIEGADRIEAVDVLGWTVVCNKGTSRLETWASTLKSTRGATAASRHSSRMSSLLDTATGAPSVACV